jgi:hypothetical protein
MRYEIANIFKNSIRRKCYTYLELAARKKAIFCMLDEELKLAAKNMV